MHFFLGALRVRHFIIPRAFVACLLIAFWVILHAFLSSADFFKINFFNVLSGLIWVQNCSQRLSTDNTSRQRVKGNIVFSLSCLSFIFPSHPWTWGQSFCIKVLLRLYYEDPLMISFILVWMVAEHYSA